MGAERGLMLLVAGVSLASDGIAMPDPSDQAELSPAVRKRCQAVVADFTEAWRDLDSGSGQVLLEPFLPPVGDPARLPSLHSLIPVDLEQRWKRGESVHLEDYVARFPDLGAVDQLPVALIWAEYRSYRQQGGSAELEGYRVRFPKQFESLAALVGGAPTKPREPPTLGSHVLGTLRPYDSDISSRRTVAGDLQGAPGATASSAPRESPDVVHKVLPAGEGYRLLKCIGRGNFGEVWKAEAPGGVEVAVKMIYRTQGDQLTQMELRALELMKRLRHPFLLQVQAYWLAGDQLHIVMDLADKTLLQRLEESQRAGHSGIPVAELVAYFHEAAEALDFLHGNQVLHRDVKPANILLANGHARIADFGLARLFMTTEIDLRATMTGTPLYMGPEVWQQKVGPESDQYSLAATYVELRIGRPLFDADSRDEVKQNHLTAAPDLKSLPTAERKVLQKALAKKTTDRFNNCSQFVQALDLAVLGPKKTKSWLTRRRVLLLLSLGAVGVGLPAEVARRNGWLAWPSIGMEVTAPAAVSLRAGERSSFQIHIVGAPDSSELRPRFAGFPEGVRFEISDGPTPGANAQIWQVTAFAELNMPESETGLQCEVTLLVDNGDTSTERFIELSIQPPVMTLPPDCEPAIGAERVAVGVANYWNRIVRKLPEDASLPSDTPCELVLIPPNTALKLPSFYILVNKVWNELFAVFDKQYASARALKRDSTDKEAEVDWPDAWSKQGAAKGADDMPAQEYPLHPVMKVNFKQAQEFAKWLRGALPTCQQWDTAAGVYLSDVAQRKGPFRGEWNKSRQASSSQHEPTVAIAIQREGTLPINEANDDVSPFGCRHMAGNGAEWTRDATAGAFSSAQLRGRQYFKDEPLMYRDLLDNDKQIRLESEDVTATSPYIGFRIVIEIQLGSP